MNTLINLVSQAAAAFKRQDYAAAIRLLDQAFEFVSAMDHTKMDERIFNALYDAHDMTQLLCQLPVFEKTSFSKQTLENYKAALDAFTATEGGTISRLKIALQPFILLLQGLSVAVLYIKKQQLHIDDFPPEISFEVTEDGYLRLFAWSDEEPNKIAAIQKLKAEFEQLFEKEKQSQAYFLDNATALQEAGAYDDCLQLLEQAMAQHDALKGECFIRKGNIYLLLQKYSEAVDAFMKARVLGEPKFKIAPQIREACKFLIRYAETKEERQQWTLLANDFS